WSTVSAVDGHRLQGQFTFGVGVAAGGGGGIAGTSPGSLALAGARALEYVGLLWAVGGLLLSLLSRRSPGLELDVRLERPLALAFASGIAVVLGQAALDSPDPLHPDLWAFLGGGSGPFLVGRLVLEGAALAAWARARPLVVPILAGALVALAAAGHAAAIQPAAFAVLADAGHLAAAGLWAGSILALAVAWLEGQRTAVAAMLQRVRPLALAGFVGSVVLGLVRAAQELGGWAGLSTSYGLTLAAKGALVLGTAGVGVAMVRWRRPGAIRIEALVALLVVAATALLGSDPLPPGPAAQASALTASQVGEAAFPEPGDLTLASNAGQVLVALSLRPGGPGRNQLLIYLQPPDGEAAAAHLPVSVRIGGTLHAAGPCGQACRRLTTLLQGGEALQVLVGGAQGGEARFTLPALPAPSGADLLLQAEQRMRQLQTYQAQETLGPARPPLAVSYTYQAPDRVSLQTSAGFERVVVGLAGYSREGSRGPWQVQKLTEPIVADSFVWDYAKPSAVRVLGEEVV
ncbi:MAG: hypothetical protein J2P45_31575, partial [Candidatus Dormibacteraeota bacterium]|nr:hypothetical protein [Candidatus Dormibacteraeota bacterium]